jgi:hypothetical protein
VPGLSSIGSLVLLRFVVRAIVANVAKILPQK